MSFSSQGVTHSYCSGLSVNRHDSGSIIPIGIGVITVSAIFSLVMAELIGVQFQTLQNMQIADVLVLKVANDLRRDQIPPVMNLDYAPAVRDILAEASSQLGVEPIEVRVATSDGKTMASTVCTQWKSITGINFGLAGRVCAQAKARAIS
jgi:hypothetical protein